MNKIKLNIIGITAFVLFTTALSFAQDDVSNTAPDPDFGDTTAASMDKFKSELSSSGEWLNVDSNDIDAEGVQADPNGPDSLADNQDNGVDEDINKDYCWRPNNVDFEWNPYTDGYWVYTDCGWYWQSDYSWGCTYHYGRWWWSSRWGWVWSPGYYWASSWVTWRSCGDYWGWYPISPRIHCRGRYRYGISHYRFNQHHWTFVNNTHFVNHITKDNIVSLDKNTLDRSKTVSNVFINNNNKVINRGPNVTQIERTTGTKITPKDVSRYNDQNKQFANRENIQKNDSKTVYRGKENLNKIRQNENGYKRNNGQKNNGTNRNGNVGKRWNGNSNNGSRNKGSHNNGTIHSNTHSRGTTHSNTGSKSHGSSKNSGKSHTK